MLKAAPVWLQVLLKPGDTYIVHADIKTSDKNTARVSISNLFNPQALKVLLPEDVVCCYQE